MPWNAINPYFEVLTADIVVDGTTRKRPMAVRGFLRGGSARTVSVCAACWAQPGGMVDAKIANTEAGHLIPLELGGADSAYNLVPMYGGVNRGTYRGLEREIGTAAGALRAPAMRVDLTYPVGAPGDLRVPTQLDVRLYGNVARLSDTDNAAAVMARTIHNTRDMPVRMVIAGTDVQLRDELLRAKAAFPQTRWKLEDEGCTWPLPPLDQRPNAWLDWLLYSPSQVVLGRKLLSKVPDQRITIGGYWNFAPAQRLLVVIANQMTQPDARIGECWSDAGAGDPMQVALTQLGTDNGIQIDHIVPKASGGPNVYSNAAVVSALYNKQKGRPLTGLDDV